MVPECLIHNVGGRLSVGIEDVAVDVGRHANRRVPEDLTDDLQFDTVGQHQARRGVPQFMRMPISQARIKTDLLEFAVEVPRFEWRPDVRSEDEA